MCFEALIPKSTCNCKLAINPGYISWKKLQFSIAESSELNKPIIKAKILKEKKAYNKE
jgi:hypothetical protein